MLLGVMSVCEYRFGEFCFNPEHLKKGELAKHYTKMPCCSGNYAGSLRNRFLDISKY